MRVLREYARRAQPQERALGRNRPFSRTSSRTSRTLQRIVRQSFASKPPRHLALVSGGRGDEQPLPLPASLLRRSMTHEYLIRPATLNDALAIAEVQVAVWQSAYRDMLPEALIARMSVEDRRKGWTTILTSYAENGTGACFVAESAGVVHGFASCGAQRDEDLQDTHGGEFSAIYVMDSFQRRGIGCALMAACATALRDRGHTAAALWVLSENAGARAFYEALSGKVVAERLDNRPENGAGGGLDEVAYGWDSLSELA